MGLAEEASKNKNVDHLWDVFMNVIHDSDVAKPVLKTMKSRIAECNGHVVKFWGAFRIASRKMSDLMHSSIIVKFIAHSQRVTPVRFQERVVHEQTILFEPGGERSQIGTLKLFRWKW